MLDVSDWNTFWRWELFRRRCDPLDFRRWKRDSSRALRTLFARRPDELLLDATAGLGDHTVNLSEEGFRVEACDASPLARESTLRAVRDAGLEVPVFDARWEQLHRTHPDRYDVIFHDAIHWVYERDAMHDALTGLRGALKPGGALVYFFADEKKPAPDEGLGVLAWDWERMQRAELAWDHRADDTAVTLTVVNDRGPDWIDQHHLFVVREGDAPARLDALTLRRVYRWDWHAMTAALARAGFVGMRSHHFPNVKGHTFAMSLAFRPA